MPGGGGPNREGFSFATTALSKLLEPIAPDLKDINQFELASRLVFLTKRAGVGARENVR